MQEELARERGAWQTTRAELERDSARFAQAAAVAEERLTQFRRTKRYRLAQALARPLERLRVGRASR